MNWGGDWAQRSLNFSSPLSTLVIVIGIYTMQGWLHTLAQAMDLNGAGLTPVYNANEHIQIFYILLYLVGGVILFNFFVGLLLFNYRRVKEQVSG